jgi:hypothetical protein
MLTFTLYTADDYGRSRRVVHIDPCAVIAVEEAERRPAIGGYHQVAVITLVTGDKYTVEDGSRRVAREIAEAKEAAEARLAALNVVDTPRQLDDANPDKLPPALAPGSLGLPNIEGTQFRSRERDA